MRDETEIAWPGWRRWLVSLCVIAHAAAIVLCILGGGIRRSPAPLLFAVGYSKTNPYLQALHLDNPYRFFAPDPGATPTIWLRVTHHPVDNVPWSDWCEYPSRSDFAFRQGYERALVRCAKIQTQIGADPTDPTRLSLLQPGVDAVLGLVKHKLRDLPESAKVEIEVFAVQRRLPTPEESRHGMNVWDLRLFRTCFIGKFDSSSEPTTPIVPQAVASSAVAGRSLSDLADHRSQRSRLPSALRWALENVAPSSPDHSPEEYRRSIESLAAREAKAWR